MVSFEWMRCSRRPLAEGLPRVRSALPRAPSQPSWVPRDTPHEVLSTAWRNDQDSDCLVDACLCGGGQHRHGTIEVQVDVKEGALECRTVLARRPPGQCANGPAHPLTPERQRFRQDDHDVAAPERQEAGQREALAEAPVQIQPVANLDEPIVKDRQRPRGAKRFPQVHIL